MKTTAILVLMVLIIALIVIQMTGGTGQKTSTALERIETSQKDIEQSLEKANTRINKLQRGVNDLKSAAVEQQNRTYLAAMDMDEIDDSETDSEADTVIAETIQGLQAQLIEMNESMESLNDQLSNTRRTMNRRTVFETWENMQNPDVMNKNLDTFAAEYSKRIEDPIQKSEFEQDIANLKEMVGKIDDPDLYDYVYNGLATRLAEATSERQQERYTRMMESLENTQNEEELQERLTRYATFGNMREIRNISEKYNIPNRTLREYGLSVRRPGGGRRGR
jgi:Trp operon repressor